VVPGKRFATVNPTPPWIRLRRDMFDLVMNPPCGVFFWIWEMGARAVIPEAPS
jgi:hypothetical protein